MGDFCLYLHLMMLPLLISRAYLDCHLMVTNPADYVEPFAKAGASGFTFHIEVTRGKPTSIGKWFIISTFPHIVDMFDTDNWQELIQSIKSKGMRPGVSLRPGTPVEEVFPLVSSCNFIMP